MTKILIDLATAQQALVTLENVNPLLVCEMAQQPRPEQQQAQLDVITVTLMREGINKHRARELADHFVKLYTTPPAPQRTWVGLTEDEKFEMAAAQYGWEDLLFAAEARLKEKNNV